MRIFDVRAALLPNDAMDAMIDLVKRNNKNLLLGRRVRGVIVNPVTGELGDAILYSVVCAAVMAYAYGRCKRAQGLYGYTSKTDKGVYISELHDQNSDIVDIVKCLSDGSVYAGRINAKTKEISSYEIRRGGKDGAAIVMVWLKILYDDPAHADFKGYIDQVVHATAEYLHGRLSSATADAGIRGLACASDYMFRAYDTTSPQMPVDARITSSGTGLRGISWSEIERTAYGKPEDEDGFQILWHANAMSIIKPEEQDVPKPTYEEKEEEPVETPPQMEVSLIPTLESDYIVPEFVEVTCKHIKETKWMRNFMFRGPAGTGKTSAARAIAAMLQRPYVYYTCSADTERADLLGQIIPDFGNRETSEVIKLKEERKEVESMGGLTYANVAEWMHMPSIEDIYFDPAGSYEALTGSKKSNVTNREVSTLVEARVGEKLAELASVSALADAVGQQRYRYQDSEIVQALQNGWVLEIQEPAVIQNPGVLVALNGLLEQRGRMMLPDGRVITRHPNTVIILTTNVDYAGCRTINQSVIDRMDMVYTVPMMAEEDMIRLAEAKVGEHPDLPNMVKVVLKMAEYCRNHQLGDGEISIRGLLAWLQSTKITRNPFWSAKSTIIEKATSDEEEQQELIETCLKPYFSA